MVVTPLFAATVGSFGKFRCWAGRESAPRRRCHQFSHEL